MLQYRKEIDGLRAIAVIPVILFHAGFENFSGGFVGVDIFFVISGYLITGIILKEKEQGRFSLLGFYERRARRILPALFLVMGACLPFAWYWLEPRSLKDFSESVSAVPVFLSNLIFWQQTGYFAAAAEHKPLLHTWSLAVEEQFYLFFPLSLMLVWALRKRWILALIIGIGAISLALAHYGAFNHPSATFFFLPTRAWELMLGASVAFIFQYGGASAKRLRQNQVRNEILGWFGFTLIVFSIIWFETSTPFPSLYALVPTIGVALIVLFTDSETTLGKVLSNRVLVLIGLISYSAYLWHVPIFVFARYRVIEDLVESQYWILIALNFVLAWLSWRFVERPFRKRDLIRRKTIFSFAIIGSLLFVVLGLYGQAANGFPERTATTGVNLGEIDRRLRPNFGLSPECEGKFTLAKSCRTSETPEIMLWGDSFAMHLASGILSSEPKAKLIQFTKSSCGPIFNIAPINHKLTKDWATGCIEFNHQVKEWASSSSTVKYAIVSSSLGQYLSEENRLYLGGFEYEEPSFELLLRQFIATLEHLETQGISPIVVSPTPSPEGVFDPGFCVSKALFFGHDTSLCDFQITDLSHDRKLAFSFLKEVGKHYPVIWLNEFICSEGQCKAYMDKKFVYRDGGHLSYEGSAKIGEVADFYSLITNSAEFHKQAVNWAKE